MDNGRCKHHNNASAETSGNVGHSACPVVRPGAGKVLRGGFAGAPQPGAKRQLQSTRSRSRSPVALTCGSARSRNDELSTAELLEHIQTCHATSCYAQRNWHSKGDRRSAALW